MKTLTEIFGPSLASYLKNHQELVASGKTGDELSAALAELWKVDADKVKIRLSALEVTEKRPEGIKRVVVLQPTEEERAAMLAGPTVSAGAKKAAAKKAQESGSYFDKVGGGDSRGGRGGDSRSGGGRDGGRGGRGGKDPKGFGSVAKSEKPIDKDGLLFVVEYFPNAPKPAQAAVSIEGTHRGRKGGNQRGDRNRGSKRGDPAGRRGPGNKPVITAADGTTLTLEQTEPTAERPRRPRRPKKQWNRKEGSSELNSIRSAAAESATGGDTVQSTEGTRGQRKVKPPREPKPTRPPSNKPPIILPRFEKMRAEAAAAAAQAAEQPALPQVTPESSV